MDGGASWFCGDVDRGPVEERGMDMSLKAAFSGEGVKDRMLTHDFKVLSMDHCFGIGAKDLGVEIENTVGYLDDDLFVLFLVELNLQLTELNLMVVEFLGSIGGEAEGHLPLFVILRDFDPLHRLANRYGQIDFLVDRGLNRSRCIGGERSRHRDYPRRHEQKGERNSE